MYIFVCVSVLYCVSYCIAFPFKNKYTWCTRKPWTKCLPIDLGFPPQVCEASPCGWYLPVNISWKDQFSNCKSKLQNDAPGSCSFLKWWSIMVNLLDPKGFEGNSMEINDLIFEYNNDINRMAWCLSIPPFRSSKGSGLKSWPRLSRNLKNLTWQLAVTGAPKLLCPLVTHTPETKKGDIWGAFDRFGLMWCVFVALEPGARLHHIEHPVA